MPIVPDLLLLRKIVSDGFCSTRIKSAAPSIGDLHAAMDLMIANSDRKILCDPQQVTGLKNAYNVRYEDFGMFLKILGGIVERDVFDKSKLGVVEGTYPIAPGSSVLVKFTLFKDGEYWVEPVYHWFNPETYFPFHTMMALALMAVAEGPRIPEVFDTTAKIRVVSTAGDFSVAKEYPMDVTALLERLRSSVLTDWIRQGPQCLTCPEKSCAFNITFDQQVYGWLKAKQLVAQLEKQLEDHLVLHGPSKAGQHLVYLQQSTRRNFKEKMLFEFLAELRATAPAVADKYVNPNTKKVLDAVAKGHLPETFRKYFYETNSHSIESEVTL